MRTAARLSLTIAITALGVHCSAPRAGAVGVLYDGLRHTALGGGVVEVDPLTRRLRCDNLGMSGQDGCEISKAAGSLGYAMTFGDYAADFATSGSSLAIVWRATVSGSSVDAVKLTVLNNSNGSQTLTPDFSAVHASMYWVELLDASGAVVRRLHKPNPFSVTTGGGPSPAIGAPGHRTLAAGGPRGIAVDIRRPLVQEISITYTDPVVIDIDGLATVSSAVRFMRNTGDPVDEMGVVRMTGTWPAGTGPGSFTIATEEIEPPCAGLDCPNGPGTSGLSLRAPDDLGELEFEPASPSGAIELAFYRKSPCSDPPRKIKTSAKRAADPPSSSPSLPSGGTTVLSNAPVTSMTLATSNVGTTGECPASMNWEVRGKVSGVEQVLGTMLSTTSGGSCTLVPDFSSVEAAGYRVVLRSGGSVVADVPNPPGGIEIPSSVVTDGPVSVGAVIPNAPDPAQLRIICITSPCPGWPVSMGGAIYFADQIDIAPIDPLPGSSIDVATDVTSLEMQHLGVTHMSIVGADFKTDGSEVDVVELAQVEFERPQVSPNPAHGPVRVVFALSRAEHVRISVIDIAGRRVRDLDEGHFTAGAHVLSWDGRDDSGRSTPVGAYFVRVEGGASVRVARVTRLQ